jgi:putative oxidoreductase
MANGITTRVDGGASKVDFAKLLLRLVLGLLMIAHGIGKARGGIDAIVDMVVAHHMPAFVAYFVYIGEIVAPAFLIVGLFTRAAAVIVVISMLFAVGLAHTGDLFSMSEGGGYALELQAFYLVTAIVVALLGAGRYSIGGRYGRWN